MNGTKQLIPCWRPSGVFLPETRRFQNPTPPSLQPRFHEEKPVFKALSKQRRRVQRAHPVAPMDKNATLMQLLCVTTILFFFT